MPEMSRFYHEKGQNLKDFLQKGMVFNSQNYDGYPLWIALTLLGEKHGMAMDYNLPVLLTKYLIKCIGLLSIKSIELSVPIVIGKLIWF